MEVENDLAKALETISDGDMEKLDESCKKMLSFKSILAWILKTCVKDFKDASLKDIEEKYIVGAPEISKILVHRDEVLAGNEMVADTDVERIEGTQNEDSTLKEGKAIFDIRFEAVIPKRTDKVITMIVNIESQARYHTGYPIIKRAVYYTGRMLSAQYGTVFANSHYEKVKPVVSLWVVLNPPNYRKNTINLYSLGETNLLGNFAEKEEYFDLITVGMICLGNEDDENSKGLVRMLSILLSSEIAVQDKKRRLREEFDIAMTKEMEKEAENMCDYSKMVEDKGIAKGVVEGLLSALKKMIANANMTPEQAMNVLDIPENERAMYTAKLSEQS